jgi:hypothetical protein
MNKKTENDLNIIKVMGILLTAGFSILPRIQKYSLLVIIIWIINVFFIIVIFIWGLYQVLFTSSFFTVSLRWITGVLIFLSPLIISILINFDLIYCNHKHLSSYVIIFYALILSLYYSINILYNKLILNS